MRTFVSYIFLLSRGRLGFSFAADKWGLTSFICQAARLCPSLILPWAFVIDVKCRSSWRSSGSVMSLRKCPVLSLRRDVRPQCHKEQSAQHTSLKLEKGTPFRCQETSLCSLRGMCAFLEMVLIPCLCKLFTWLLCSTLPTVYTDNYLS